jgi:hypothetical protein
VLEALFPDGFQNLKELILVFDKHERAEDYEEQESEEAQIGIREDFQKIFANVKKTRPTFQIPGVTFFKADDVGAPQFYIFRSQ